MTEGSSRSDIAGVAKQSRYMVAGGPYSSKCAESEHQVLYSPGEWALIWSSEF